jgi:hypothetical protein
MENYGRHHYADTAASYYFVWEIDAATYTVGIAEFKLFSDTR